MGGPPAICRNVQSRLRPAREARKPAGHASRPVGRVTGTTSPTWGNPLRCMFQSLVPTLPPPDDRRRLTDILRALPQGELDGLVDRLAIRIDPAKRIDASSQVARALVSLPELRDPTRLNPACMELMHRVAEARGSLVVGSVPPALEPLLARGLMFARSVG